MRPSKQWQGGLTGRLADPGRDTVLIARDRGEGGTEATRKGRGSKHNCSAIMLPICSSHLQGGGGGAGVGWGATFSSFSSRGEERLLFFPLLFSPPPLFFFFFFLNAAGRTFGGMKYSCRKSLRLFGRNKLHFPSCRGKKRHFCVGLLLNCLQK